MEYEVRHSTAYDYEHDVSLSHHVAHLTPRETTGQHCRQHRIEALPRITTSSSHVDHFGNLTNFLTVEGAHRRLEVIAWSRVEVLQQAPLMPEAAPPWETVRDRCGLDSATVQLEAAEFVFGSPLAPCRADLAEYARPAFPAGRPILAGALDLCQRIHADFKFDQHATSVMTTVQEFFKTRRGVCQDFAHLTVACLRSLGLPARYVSGYLETLPPPGKPKLVGTDASHAWASVWCGDQGWSDVDPTNNLLPSERHITTAWGRDYADVAPLRGVLVGGGRHKLTVSVDVQRLDSPAASG
jgi:transglutaminase-like putative cysteine protease